MSDSVLMPIGGELRPQTYQVVLFDLEIVVRVAVTSSVEPEFFPQTRPTTVDVEDVDLGVSDWRQLADREVAFPPDQDAAFYWLASTTTSRSTASPSVRCTETRSGRTSTSGSISGA